jgi:hypothetical protein
MSGDRLALFVWTPRPHHQVGQPPTLVSAEVTDGS